jgi:two-component SAPR family response regulator
MSASNDDVIAIQKRLKAASAELNSPAMISLYAQARQVISYDSDRRKNLLAKYTVKYLKEGESATAAEAKARADTAYQAEFQTQAEELQTAEGVIAKRRGVETSWESARSLLSFQREGFKHMPETEA